MAREQFFLPIKVIGMLRTRGKSGIGLPSAGHPLALPHRWQVIQDGVGWRAGKKFPSAPSTHRAVMWSVGKATLVGPIMSRPHYKMRCPSEQHPLNNAHITMTTAEFDT